MLKYIIPLFSLLLMSFPAFAQETKPAPDRASEPNQAYPITNRLEVPALREFDESFPNENVGFLHIYANPSVDVEEVYLLRGEPLSSTATALLPGKFQRMAKVMNAELYGAMAVKGINESMYILRMDGQFSDRIEMFAIRGNKVVHLKTLAYRTCANGKCDQLDSYLTNLDSDTNLELVQIKRTMRGTGETTTKPKAFVLKDRNRKWKRTNKLEIPMTSIQFYDPTSDRQ